MWSSSTQIHSFILTNAKSNSDVRDVQISPTLYNIALKIPLNYDDDDDDDDDDEIAYFTVRWKTTELVLSTAPKNMR